MTDGKDKYLRMKTSLLAFACGDALGATVEFRSPDSIRQEYGVHRQITGGGWLFLEPGAVTDDTQMAQCVAGSLMDCGGFNLKDIADRFVDWYNSDPPDIGGACRRGIQHYIRTGEPGSPYDPYGAGNGGVMRALPLILYYAHDRERQLDAVVAQSRLTHNNKESDEGCRCYADMVSHALAGAGMDELRQVLANYPLFAAELYEGKSSGYVVDTLRTVFHCFFASGSLEECVVAVVNRGEDADTTGALAGGLAGAFYGSTETVPKQWLEALDGDVCDELLSFARFLEGRSCKV